jgi:transposase
LSRNDDAVQDAAHQLRVSLSDVRELYLYDLAFALTRPLEPPELLKIWHDITDTAASDLTDTEWDLTEPFIPAGGPYADTYMRVRARTAVNGMLYWTQENCNWSHVPIRYGAWQAIYQRYFKYKRNGVFARMLEALQENTEAARITAWPRSELG